MKRFNKCRVLSVILTFALLLGVFPTGLFGGVAQVYAAETSLGDSYSRGEWSASTSEAYPAANYQERVTGWSANASVTNVTLSEGDTINGIAYDSGTVKLNGNGYITLKMGAMRLPLDSDTVAVKLEFTLASNNTLRSVVVGDATTEVVSQNTADSPAINSNKYYSNTYKKADGYFSGKGLKLESITSGENDGGETKFTNITITEYKEKGNTTSGNDPENPSGGTPPGNLPAAPAADEFELDVTLDGNGVTDNTKWSLSSGWYKLDSSKSTAKVVQSNGVFGYWPTGSKIKMKEGLNGIQLDGSVNAGGNGQAAIEMDLTNVPSGNYGMRIEYLAKGNAATLKLGDSTGLAEVGSSNSSKTEAVVYTTTLASGKAYQVGAGNGAVVKGISLSKLTEVTVSGKVSCAAGTTLPASCSLSFQELDAEGTPVAGKTYSASINVVDGSYSVSLPAASYGTDYSVSFSDSEYIFNPAVEKITVTKGAPAQQNFTVLKAAIYELKGSYKNGLGDDWTKLTGLTFTPVTDSSYAELDVTLDKTLGTYSVMLEKGTTYAVTAAGVNDYRIMTGDICYSADTLLDLSFAEKTKYPVTITLGTTPDLTGKNITYSFVHEDGTVYSFVDASAITLRDGQYAVSLGGDFSRLAYDIRQGAALTINGAAENHVITFQEVTTWSFRDLTEKFEGKAGYFKGLYVDAAAGKLAPHSSGSAQFNTGTRLSVPVKGKCSISVTAYQDGSYAKYTINGTAAKTDAITTTIEYDGGAGMIDVIATGNTYIASISLTYPAKEVVYVAQPEMPAVPEDDTDSYTAGDTDGIPRANKKDSMVVQPVGQKLTLSQTGGNFEEKIANIKAGAYYLFPVTDKKDNKLEFDVVVTEAKSTGTGAGFFGGIITNNHIYTLGLRKGGTNLRNVYSKNGGYAAGYFAGAGGADEAVPLGTVVHYVIGFNGDKPLVTASYEKDGEEKNIVFSQGLEIPSDAEQLYYGFALANIGVSITNMIYTDASGRVLYDQNACYYPEGTTPVASAVSATAAATREYIDVSWTGSVPEGDAVYVVEMQKDGGEWIELTQEVKEFTYRYIIPGGEGGNYRFRVCGQLGKKSLGGVRTAYATMQNEVYVLGALERPVVSIREAAESLTISWNAIEGAEYYKVYRYSYDEGEEGARCIAERLTATSYQDTAVEKELPYYYQVKAVSDSTDNASALSEVVWQVATAGHTGEYVYEDEATEIFITKKSYDTVFTNKVILEGNVYGDGTLKAVVNGKEAVSRDMNTRDAFSLELQVEQGRNDVNLLFTDKDGKVTRKTFNFVYLTNYDMVVDASYTGADGAQVNGIPTYSTVQAAVDSVPLGNKDSKVILVMAGSYEERLEVNTPYISLIGEDRENTLIHYYPGVLGEKYEAGGDMDKRCAIYIKSGAKGFSAENISFANDYVYATADGKSNKSADAIRVEADKSSFVNVKFTGVQDTLYMHEGNQYYYKCLIEGLVDFIYSGDKARAFFNDCEILFVYESTKTAGYVCAPKTKADADYGLTFYNCVLTGEEGCAGTDYLLARPWGADAYITWIDCYMGKVINKREPYSDMSGNPHEEARFFEYGTFGPGFAINVDRRQISAKKAKEMIGEDYLGWNPEKVTAEISSDHYVGTIVTNRQEMFGTSLRDDSKYLQSDGEDTGLKQYDVQGYASAYGVTGGGLLKESNRNYYKVATAEEFLNALLAIKTSGKNSVIELTADINLGCNEIENFASYSKIIQAHGNQPLTHPTLIDTGVSKLTLEKFYNLTVFSQNGASIKHTTITMKNSGNIMFRNIKFDELWEWDEATGGDYDRNDWDYMTIDSGCDGIWIDHCTFYKAYDGIVDIKNPAPVNNVTISWCEFLPGSEGDEFFEVMMAELEANPEKYPETYQNMLNGGMTKEQIYGYAHAQKKTHLLGQSDEATNAAGIHLTMANNYYKNSMDRLPRLRYGNAHVYNCVMDAQELLELRASISDPHYAQKVVSNGAISTCGGQVLLENCFINGIQNALNSGNGNSPSGYINAVDSVYYMDGVKTGLEPKANSKTDNRVLLTDAEEFRAELPYSGYHLYDAESLTRTVVPYAGAGKLNLTVLQWEKVMYNAVYEAPDVPANDEGFEADVYEGLKEEEILTEEIKAATGANTVEELVSYLQKMLSESAAAKKLMPELDTANTKVVDVVLKVTKDNGLTWQVLTADNFPEEGLELFLPYPEGTNSEDYDFVIGHMVTVSCNGMNPGEMEFFIPEKTAEGLKICIKSASPFVIGWEKVDTGDDSEDDEEDEDDETGKQDGGKKPLNALLSPKTFFEDGSFIHGILWPEADSKEEAAANADADKDAASDTGSNAAGEASVTATTVTQDTEAHGNNLFTIIVVAAIAVIGASAVVLFRKKEEEN